MANNLPGLQMEQLSPGTGVGSGRTSGLTGLGSGLTYQQASQILPQQQMTTPTTPTFQADKASLFSTIMTGVSAVTDPVGTIVNGIINYWGASEQAKENERARKANEAMVNRALKTDERRYQTALGMQKRGLQMEEEAAQDVKETRNFNRGVQFYNKFNQFLNGSDTLRDGMRNLWR